MCMFNTPKANPAVLPPETAAMKEPDAGAVRSSTGRRRSDQLRGSADTVLTSGSGVTTAAPTEKKTLLGQ